MRASLRIIFLTAGNVLFLVTIGAAAIRLLHGWLLVLMQGCMRT